MKNIFLILFLLVFTSNVFAQKIIGGEYIEPVIEKASRRHYDDYSKQMKRIEKVFENRKIEGLDTISVSAFKKSKAYSDIYKLMKDGTTLDVSNSQVSIIACQMFVLDNKNFLYVYFKLNKENKMEYWRIDKIEEANYNSPNKRIEANSDFTANKYYPALTYVHEFMSDFNNHESNKSQITYIHDSYLYVKNIPVKNHKNTGTYAKIEFKNYELLNREDKQYTSGWLVTNISFEKQQTANEPIFINNATNSNTEKCSNIELGHHSQAYNSNKKLIDRMAFYRLAFTVPKDSKTDSEQPLQTIEQIKKVPSEIMVKFDYALTEELVDNFNKKTNKQANVSLKLIDQYTILVIFDTLIHRKLFAKVEQKNDVVYYIDFWFYK